MEKLNLRGLYGASTSTEQAFVDVGKKIIEYRGNHKGDRC